MFLQLLMATNEHCKEQSNNLKGAHIAGGVTINDSHSGENFCGNAGNTTGHSRYVNKTRSSARSSADSSSGQNAG